jgi:exodeoxyribonuclease V beta subunit
VTSVRVPRPSTLPPASDRFVVVEASAGTGKTFFLEHRVVDLILGGAELGQILLVTFTDKAVAELRLRIRDLLDRLSRVQENGDGEATDTWEIDEAARKRLRAAVTAFDHAPIFTIHGFCNRVLIEDAFAANRLFQQQQVADEVALDAAFTALLREKWARVEPARELLAAYLEWGNTVDKLRDLMLSCVRADATVTRRYNPLAAQAAGAKLRAAFGTSELRAQLLQITPWRGKQGNAAKWLDGIGHALDTVDERPAAILAAIDTVRKDAQTMLKYVAGSPKTEKAYDALVTALGQQPLGEAIATELLPDVIERIGADKAEAGQFDYDDMLQLVARALDGDRGEELAHRLRTRMPWVMIDEFQDTDPVQWRIFERVWLHDAARGLTIVGDPKQAIYGFRGADVRTYLEARDQLVRAGATVVPLDVNRRSTAPLVDAINEILIGQPLAPLLDKAITYDTPVKASGDVVCEGSRPPVTVFELKGGGRDDQRDAHATAIGVEIERLRAQPPVWRSRSHAPAAFSLGHVMVLTRSNKESLAIAAALRARGLACALVESDRLFQTREAAELAAVLEAVAYPRDRSARMRALRTRFFDVPWADLAQVVDAPDHHPLIARLFDWAALAGKREYELLFRRLVENSRFAERALVLGGGERAHVNTWHLLELLLEEVARSRCDLGELTVRLRRWINEHESLAGGGDERDVQRAETDTDAIRILTIHKSKGLEAPYVFLFGCASAAPSSKVSVVRDAAGRTLWVDTSDETVKAHVATETDAENQRLAYVALTRAQIRLYLPLYSEKNVASTATYQPILRCITPLVGHKPALFESIVVDVGGEEPPDPPPDALASFDVPPPPVVAELAPLAAERAGHTMLSYTRLAKQLAAAAIDLATQPFALERAEVDADTADAVDLDDSDDEPIAVGPDELPGGSDAGSYLHALFEDADLAGLRASASPEVWAARPDVAALLGDKAREWNIGSQYIAHAARMVHTTLTEPLALTDGTTLPPLVAATALARELEFSYPAPGHSPPRAMVKGFIDALVAYDDELWVLDYKSDLLHGSDLAAAARAHVDDHYMVQARLYALAADRMRRQRRFAGLLYTFVRYNVTVALRVDEDTLPAWTTWLATLPARSEATS